MLDGRTLGSGTFKGAGRGGGVDGLVALAGLDEEREGGPLGACGVGMGAEGGSDFGLEMGGGALGLGG